MKRRLLVAIAALVGMLGSVAYAQEADAPARPAPPSDLIVEDHPWDGGEQIDVGFALSADDKADAEPKSVIGYAIQRSGERRGLYEDVVMVPAEERDYRRGRITFTVENCERLEPYFFRVAAVGPDGARSEFLGTTEAVRASRQLFAGTRFWMALITLAICVAVITYIFLARAGWPLKIRKIAGLEAIDEAVGRATEMGRSCLFVPGLLDMNDIQTIAGMTVLSHVSKTAAQYGAQVEVPTSKSLVMTTARETVQSAFLAAGRPDAYNDDMIYYVTDEQFGYVAYISGMMVREKPAACFYMGAFYAESLILAETGNAIGAIQVAGTAQPAQLPFFVAACDYTLIGEEFFAASAYLSGEPEQLGSLKGQDMGKILAGLIIVTGSLTATLAAFDGAPAMVDALYFFKDVLLK